MTINYFKNKTVLITGGTGSIGSQILNHLLNLKVKKVIVFSRDEYKQHKLRYQYQNNTVISYALGNVRDLESLNFYSRNVDIIYHCAALKHVPISEEMPEEFIKTNILGSFNVKKAALNNNVSRVISISTDKAVDSLNVMGLSKAIQEKIFTSSYLHSNDYNTNFISVRFGNVIGTNGSLFPIIYHQITNNLPITITHPEMTRFFMTKKEAIEMIFWATLHGSNGEIVINKMKSFRILNLIKIFIEILKKPASYPINYIGIRVGEKMHESLINSDELYRIKKNKNHYIITPYTTREIQKNIIRKTNYNMNIQEFLSNNPKNFFSQKEIIDQINKSINEIKLFSNYI